MIVYLLSHYYEYGHDKQFEEFKILGVFSSENRAQKEIEFFYTLPGFKDHPKNCFYIDSYEMDKIQEWTTGFLSE